MEISKLDKEVYKRKYNSMEKNHNKRWTEGERPKRKEIEKHWQARQNQSFMKSWYRWKYGKPRNYSQRKSRLRKWKQKEKRKELQEMKSNLWKQWWNKKGKIIKGCVNSCKDVNQMNRNIKSFHTYIFLIWVY